MTRFYLFHKGLQAVIFSDVNKVAVIKACTAEIFVMELKCQGMYEMQTGAAVGAQADNVACIGRNFRLIEYNMEHPDCHVKIEQGVEYRLDD